MQHWKYAVNFTREPIIETVITPREGCKLVVRSSKGANQEDYFVDAVEVVSFGHSFFFRSLERPKSFLVPVSDYEILELKETRMVLKNMGSERSIKIGGGRDMSVRSPREAPEESYSETPVEGESAAPEQQQTERMDKKQGRRRSRRRRGGGGQMESSMEGKRTEASSVAEYPEEQESSTQSGGAERVEEAAPSFISKLFPPPPTLIKETLSRYKTSEEGIVLEEKAALHEELFEHPTAEEERPLPDKDSDEETEE